MAEREQISKKNNKLSKTAEQHNSNTSDHGRSSESISTQERTEGDSSQIGRGMSMASVAINREEYLQAYRDLTNELHQLRMKNHLLHRRLADYYKKRKHEHVLKSLDNSDDLEEKYQQKLLTYNELKGKEEREMNEIKSQVQVVEVQFFDRLQQATKKFDDLQYLERNTGTGLIYSKKGKPIAEKTVERLLTLQKHKCEQASAMCLRYIRVRNAVTELETTVRKLEKLGPGLYVAQYEQLYIDKQNYMNKIEERDDELIKHRTKCTEHNQILAHIREKMNHTDEVIDFSLSDLGDTELEFLKAREELGQLKNHRNRLRWSLEAERLKAGLLTRKDLLRDYQNAIDEVVNLRTKKHLLETQISNIKKKLREKRPQMPFQRTDNGVCDCIRPESQIFNE